MGTRPSRDASRHSPMSHPHLTAITTALRTSQIPASPVCKRCLTTRIRRCGTIKSWGSRRSGKCVGVSTKEPQALNQPVSHPATKKALAHVTLGMFLF